jgi:hypothetical protein
MSITAIILCLALQIGSAIPDSCETEFGQRDPESHGYFRGCDIKLTDYMHINQMLDDLSERAIELPVEAQYTIGFAEDDEKFVLSLSSNLLPGLHCELGYALYRATYWFDTGDSSNFEIRELIMFNDEYRHNYYCQ